MRVLRALAVVLLCLCCSTVQAAEVKVNGCTAWGVQYHPEYTLGDIAATFRRHGKRLVEENFFNNGDELIDYADTVAALHAKIDAARETLFIAVSHMQADSTAESEEADDGDGG